MRLQALLDVGKRGGLEPLARCALQRVGEVLEPFRDRGVEHHVAVRGVHVGTGHAELELVPREGEGARAVAVRVVDKEARQLGDAQVHGRLFGARILVASDERVHDGAQLVAEEDGHDGRRRLVRAKTVVVARRGDGHAQELLAVIDRRDDAREDHEEAQVLHGALAWVEEVLSVRGQGPVVVLAGAVDALERLFVQQAHQAVMAGQKAHLLHGEQVLVNGAVRVREDGSQLVLGGCHLVVLRLGGDAELPQLLVKLLHELVHRGADGAEVVLFQLLAFARRRAEERAAREHQVLAARVVFLWNQEELLFIADGGHHALGRFAEQGEHALRLLVDGVHGAQKRGLLVEGLARVAAERRRDAQHLVLHEGVARRVPCGVTARLEGGAQAAVWEARRVGLALNELLAREAHNGAAVARGLQEGIVLFRRDARQRLEPVREVRGPALDGPFFHGVGYDVGDVKVERLSFLYGLNQAFVSRLRQALLHGALIEHHRPVDFRNVSHDHSSLSVRTGRP